MKNGVQCLDTVMFCQMALGLSTNENVSFPLIYSFDWDPIYNFQLRAGNDCLDSSKGV
jgi:hypothetical protein